MAPAREHFFWPALPYKGLSYYGPDDVPLFAGRENDVGQCAKLLGLNSTRILILHGATGCGKSSFLRAGLIPFVERVGFEFQREVEGQGGKAIFVRSTDNPLGKLAESVYDFCSRPYQIETFFGPETLDLSQLLSDYSNRKDFLERAGTDAEEMVQVLSEVASKWPRTMVLVIDQAEEVLTVNIGDQGEKYRKQLFEFMSIFSKKKFDLKLLVALRTEFYGRFFDRVRQVAADTVNIRDYLLTELSEEQIITAIERPTLTANFGGWGAPYEFYGFAYEQGVAKAIANDLKGTAVAGGELPVMQIVCDNLYRTTKLRAEMAAQAKWTIGYSDYRGLGGIEGQMDEHLRRVLEDLCRENNIEDLDTVREMDYWKEVLNKLVKTQVDGTVTTELSSAERLAEVAEETGCKIPFDIGAQYLSNDERRILRSVDVIDQKTKIPIHCYSLGHDVIGLVLRRWQVSRETPTLRHMRGAEERLRFWVERAKRSFSANSDGGKGSLFSRFRSLLSQPIPVTESLRLWRYADKDRRRILKRNILVFCSRVVVLVLIGLLLFGAGAFVYDDFKRRDSRQISEIKKNPRVKAAAGEAGGKRSVAEWEKALIGAGEPDTALADLAPDVLKPDNSKSVAADDDYFTTDVYADVGTALLKANRKDQAYNLWQRAIDLAAKDLPEDSSHAAGDKFLLRLVPPLTKVGEYEKALDAAHRIKDPINKLRGLLAVTVARAKKGDATNAEQQWQEALDLVKQIGEVRGVYLLAAAMAYAGEFDRAWRVLELMDKVDDTFFKDDYRNASFAAIARSLANTKRFSEALDTARKIKADAVRLDVLAHIALRFSKAGQADDANKAFAEATEAAAHLEESANETDSRNGRGRWLEDAWRSGYARISGRFAEADKPEMAKKYLQLALKDGTSMTIRVLESDSNLEALYQVVAALGRSGQDEEGRKLAILVEGKARGRALTELNSALTRSGRIIEALNVARQEDGFVRFNALSAVAAALTEMRKTDEAKKVWDEAYDVARQLGSERSSAFATIGKGLACSHLYYDARLLADLCGIPSDRLEVYAAILSEYQRAKQNQPEASKLDCLSKSQKPWEIKYDDGD